MSEILLPTVINELLPRASSSLNCMWLRPETDSMCSLSSLLVL